MHLQKRTQYGLRAAVRLAGRYAAGGYVQSKDLAEEERMPGKFLEQVMLVLRRANLLESKVGSGGGYRLRRPPERIPVTEVLAALEPPAEVETTSPATVGCRAVEKVASRLCEGRDRAFDGWTLADLADEATRAAERAGAMYYI